LSRLPIVIIAFNRPDYLKKVLSAVREYSPPCVYFFNDGPKTLQDKLFIAENLRSVKNILSNIEVKVYARENNLGAKANIQDALNVFFNQEEFGIILEDDCIPTQSFFEFVEIAKNTHNVFFKDWTPIAGTRFKTPLISRSVLESRYPHIWGWACSKSYWELFPQTQEEIDNLYTAYVRKRLFLLPGEKNFFRSYKASFFSNESGHIDYILFLVNAVKKIKFIIPPTSLVLNTGFDYRSTNTFDSSLKDWIDKQDVAMDEEIILRRNTFSLIRNWIYDLNNLIFIQLLSPSYFLYVKHLVKTFFDSFKCGS
jgi:hypothetical protein